MSYARWSIQLSFLNIKTDLYNNMTFGLENYPRTKNEIVGLIRITI